MTGNHLSPRFFSIRLHGTLNILYLLLKKEASFCVWFPMQCLLSLNQNLDLWKNRLMIARLSLSCCNLYNLPTFILFGKCMVIIWLFYLYDANKKISGAIFSLEFCYHDPYPNQVFRGLNHHKICHPLMMESYLIWCLALSDVSMLFCQIQTSNDVCIPY